LIFEFEQSFELNNLIGPNKLHDDDSAGFFSAAKKVGENEKVFL
jgi:hypothetical protein